MDVSTRASGTETLGTAKASRDTLMAILTSVSLSTVRRMAKESIPGRMARSMMVSGTRGSSKGMASGKVSRMTLT